MKSIIRIFIITGLGLALVGPLAPPVMQAAQLPVSSTDFTQSDATPLANSPRMKKRSWHTSTDKLPPLGALSVALGIVGIAIIVLSIVAGFMVFNLWLSMGAMVLGFIFGLTDLIISRDKRDLDRKFAIAGMLICAVPFVLILKAITSLRIVKIR